MKTGNGKDQTTLEGGKIGFNHKIWNDDFKHWVARQELDTKEFCLVDYLSRSWFGQKLDLKAQIIVPIAEHRVININVLR